MTLDLLRFTTAGSVDDGKSTLIGRLLYDSKQVFEDQLEHVDAGERAARRRGRARSGAADRRAARRARAGDHDRRRLPLFRDAEAALHHRRLPRAPAVHAQHGHGRLDRRRRGDPARRAQRGAGAVKAPRVHQRAARDPASWSSRSTRWTSSSTPRSASRSSWRSSRALRPTCARAWRRAGDQYEIIYMPISALNGDNVVERSQADALV